MFRFMIAVFGFLAAFAGMDSCRAQGTTLGLPAKPAEQLQLTYSAWTRSCTRDVDVNGKQICFAAKAGRNESGRVVVAAVLVEREAEARKTLRVLVPLAMRTTYGTRVIVDSNKPLQSPYAFCSTDGCASDYDATPDLMDQLRKGNSLAIQAINSSGSPLSLSLPLADFNRAYAGNATDWGAFDEQQKRILTASFRIKNEAGQPEAKPTLIYAPWRKFCLKGQEANATQTCFIGKDGRAADSGQPVVAAVAIEPEGGAKKILRVTLPLGVQISNGTRITIDSNAPATSAYVICFANGCMSDYEMTPALLANLRNGRSLTVQAFENTGRVLTMALPLADFNAAHDGPPSDPREFEAQQRKLQEK